MVGLVAGVRLCHLTPSNNMPGAHVGLCRYILAEAYCSKSPELAAMVLSTMQRYISWIDIGLVANDK